jgi:ABC-type Zn uptake system ZnuABC Zn-binding protein ZnuA
MCGWAFTGAVEGMVGTGTGRKTLVIAIVAVAVVAIVVAAGIAYYAGSQEPRPLGRNLLVVTSIAPLENIIKNVGGDRVEILRLVSEGRDSHTFHLSVTQRVIVSANADIVIVNGLGLETSIESAAAEAENKNLRLLRLADSTISRDEWIFDFSFPEEGGNPNPHLWPDVKYTMRYAELVRDELSAADPYNADYYAENAERYLALLRQLDSAIAGSTQTIPPENRKLLTYHDSWPYFAKRYGLEVVGAVQPTDFGKPTEEEISMIVEQIRDEDVPAIFESEVFPTSVINRIASEANVEVVGVLRDDDLPGSTDSPEHTYVGMMVADVSVMVTALGGDASLLDQIDPENTFLSSS